jgi:hypothetical protein
MWIIQVQPPNADYWKNTPNIHPTVEDALFALQWRKDMAIQKGEEESFRLVECRVLYLATNENQV